MNRSIFGKVLLSHIAVILVSTTTLGFFMTYLVRSHVVEAKRTELLARGQAVIFLLLGHEPTATPIEAISKLTGAVAWIEDSNGTILAGAPPGRWAKGFAERQQDMDALFAGTAQSWVRTSRKNIDRSVTVAIPIPGSSPPAALFLYAPLTGINKTIQALDKLLLVSFIIGTAAAIALAFILSRSLIRPISNISYAAAQFARGRYDSRATVVGDDELGQLGRIFNKMAATLAQTEQQRREFLANASHELKTPVASIQALAETLYDGMASDPAQQKRYLAAIVDEIRHMGRLIHDLLDLSQLEAGELAIAAVPISVPSLLQTEVDKYTLRLTANQISLKIAPSAAQAVIQADPVRMSQVLTNLIDNAIRHSPKNTKITVSADADAANVRLTVTDQGPGIPKQDLPYIWDRFYRVDKARARNDGGTGLGLAITKKLVTAMGGDIAVGSTVGRGTSFTVTMPLQKK